MVIVSRSNRRALREVRPFYPENYVFNVKRGLSEAVVKESPG